MPSALNGGDWDSGDLLTQGYFYAKNRDWLSRLIARICWHGRDGISDFLAFRHFSEYGVVAVQMGSGSRRDKNWLPLVSGPEFAMARMPGRLKTNLESISSSNW